MRQIIYPEMSENPLLLLAFRVMYYMTKLADAGIFAAAAPAKEEPDETEEEPQTEPEQQPENGSSRHKRKEIGRAHV